MMWWIGGAVVWVVCGACSYAWNFAYWQGSTPTSAGDYYWADRMVSAAMALFGPMDLVVTAIFLWQRGVPLGKYGLKWK